MDNSRDSSNRSKGDRPPQSTYKTSRYGTNPNTARYYDPIIYIVEVGSTRHRSQQNHHRSFEGQDLQSPPNIRGLQATSNINSESKANGLYWNQSISSPYNKVGTLLILALIYHISYNYYRDIIWQNRYYGLPVLKQWVQSLHGAPPPNIPNPPRRRTSTSLRTK